MTTDDKSPRTPRTRNRVFDETYSYTSYNGEGLIFRQELESYFRSLGFRSHKFSHKNEPSYRSADSLWLSWTPWGKDRAGRGATENIEVRITFIGETTTYKITHEGRGRRSCVSYQMGKVTFEQSYRDYYDIMIYINHLLSKPLR